MQSKALKIISLIDRIVSQTIVILFAFVLCVCIYVIYDSIRIHNETKIISDAGSLIENTPDEDRISELKKTNSEITAWITLDGTAVDYPITQTSNNQFYLSHDYKKNYSIAGNIFADYRSNLLTDDYAVIYGHNMNGESMFGELNKFEDKSFFGQHGSGRIYLEDGSLHDLSVLNFAIVASDNEYSYELEKVANGANESIIKYISSISINKSDTDKYPNTLILLSTCYKHSSQRAVLLVGYNR